MTTHSFSVTLKTLIGVLERKQMSGTATSGPAAVLSAGRRAIYGHFVFSVCAPRPVKVTWFRNGGRLGSAQLVPILHVRSRLASAQGLRRGQYTAVASVNGINIGLASVRLR